MKVNKDQFRHRALELIRLGGRSVVSRLAEEFGISRTAASRRVAALVESGVVVSSGTTRARTLRLAVMGSVERTYACDGLREDLVWREVFRDVVADLSENVRSIWNYGITEMVNNAIDHSGSPTLTVGVVRDAIGTLGWVSDEGEGIFLKIQRALGLYDPRESILELAKGKLTTDPAHHSGEGIFFSSRVFDTFLIRSHALSFFHDRPGDWLLEQADEESVGTQVVMELANDSTRNPREVMDAFAAPDSYTFAKTIVPVRLAQYEGETLVSRSQAKRLHQRFERFQHVLLDFDQVATIGQAFADELFRVFSNEHPQVELTPINMAPPVEQMVLRARHGAQPRE